MLALAVILAQAVPPPEMVRLDFPESVELQVLVEYVAASLDLNLIYDAGLLKKKVSLRAAQPIPKSSLLSLLRTVLRSRGLALLDAEQPGWLKIVAAERLAAEAGGLQHALPADAGAGDVITYVLPVQHAELQRISTALTPYLSRPGVSLLPIPESRLLLIVDYAGNLRRMTQIAALLDVQSITPVIETIAVRHQDPAELATMVTRLMAEQSGARGAKTAAGTVSLQPDPISGGLIAVGVPQQVRAARALIERFDVRIERRTELYQPRYTTAARLKTLIEQLLPGAARRMAVDEAGNTLIVTAGDTQQQRIAELLQRFDSAPPASARPLRFYKLFNRRADDVFATLGALLGGQMAAPADTNDNRQARQPGGPPARSSARFGRQRDSRPSSAPRGGHADSASQSNALAFPPRPPEPQRALDESALVAPTVTAIQGENFSLSLDEHTNSIIAIAPPELHRQIEQLVAQLDKRRPQVLVEVTLVSVSVDDSLSLGVELQAIDLSDPWNYLLFTSFGLSSINPTSGQRRLNVLPGGSGVLLAPDEVPLILQALATRGETRIYSAARILVDDNATGSIESVSESPFTSVNASDTVATTSFAGFAKAGTQLRIEPHIAEGDHVEINYSLTVSSFTGSGTGTTPPPRSSDTLNSTVRVPDGYTVLVGGLLTETLGESVSQVPLLGDLPLLGWLFGNRNNASSKVRLYAFIRPTILRDDRFEDLKYLSLKDLQAAGVSDGLPPSRWQFMR